MPAQDDPVVPPPIITLAAAFVEIRTLLNCDHSTAWTKLQDMMIQSDAPRSWGYRPDTPHREAAIDQDQWRSFVTPTEEMARNSVASFRLVITGPLIVDTPPLNAAVGIGRPGRERITIERAPFEAWLAEKRQATQQRQASASSAMEPAAQPHPDGKDERRKRTLEDDWAAFASLYSTDYNPDGSQDDFLDVLGPLLEHLHKGEKYEFARPAWQKRLSATIRMDGRVKPWPRPESPGTKA